MEADGKRIALLHSHDKELLRSIIAHGSYDVVVHGHDHKAKVEKRGSTLVVNPGEVWGYVTGRSSFAVLDARGPEANIFDL